MKTIDLYELSEFLDKTSKYRTTWHWITKYCKANPDWWNSIAKDLIQSLADRIPPIFKEAPWESFRIDKEIGFIQREGPEYKFESFIEPPKHIWNISGIASFPISIKTELWKEFSSTNKISYWSLENWSSASLATKDILTDNFSKQILGLKFTQINPLDKGLLAWFQNFENWSHWNYIEFQSLWSEKGKEIHPWIDILNNHKLEHFALNSCSLDVAAYRKLGQLTEFWNNTQSLNLEQVMFGSEELSALLEGNPPIHSLQYLSLNDSPMSNGGKETLKPKDFVRIAKAGWFKNLEYLQLWYHELGRDGLLALAESGGLSSLKCLSLTAGNFDDEILLTLGSLPWKQLACINISYSSKLSDTAIEKFKLTTAYNNCISVYIHNLKGKPHSKGAF